jgi:hypothetical protein
MSWNREGQHVAGIYLNAYVVNGTVTESRVKYGGSVQHTISLDTPMTLFGISDRTVLLLDEEDLFAK